MSIGYEILRQRPTPKTIEIDWLHPAPSGAQAPTVEHALDQGQVDREGCVGSRLPHGGLIRPFLAASQGGRETGRVFGTSGARPALPLRLAEAPRSGAKGSCSPCGGFVENRAVMFLRGSVSSTGVVASTS